MTDIFLKYTWFIFWDLAQSRSSDYPFHQNLLVGGEKLNILLLFNVSLHLLSFSLPYSELVLSGYTFQLFCYSVYKSIV